VLFQHALEQYQDSNHRTYHSFKFEKYVYRYLAEAQYRFNRRFDLRKMLPRLLYAVAVTEKRTEPWSRMAEERR
jgi:hypothetical protein